MQLKKDKIDFVYFGQLEKLTITEAEYSNGRTAILLNCDNGEPFCKLTVNLYDEPDVKENQFFIKNNGPEFDVAKFMEEEGLIKRTNRIAPSVYVKNYAMLWEVVT